MKETNHLAPAHQHLRYLSLAQIRELRQSGLKRRHLARPPHLKAQKRGELLPLSYSQERLWFLDQLGLAGSAYNLRMAIKLEGALDGEVLVRSFTEVIRRHEILRTRFESIAGSPVQIIDLPRPFVLTVRDLSQTRWEDRSTQLQRMMQANAVLPFDLACGPLLRASLFKLAELEHTLLIVAHHIVSDGWSRGVLVDELCALYDAYATGEPSPLPELSVQYGDYVIWQREWLQGDVFEAQLQFWKERLLGAPPQIDLPADRPRPAVESFKGAAVNFELSRELSTALKELARQGGATLFMVTAAAFQLLLARLSGQADVLVGLPIAGRRARETEGLIGCFINTLVLRTTVTGNMSFRQLLAEVKEVALDAYANQDLPFEELVKELRPERNLARQPIFQVMLALHSQSNECIQASRLKWTWTHTDREASLFDLMLYLFEGTDRISATYDYSTDLFDHETIERMATNFQALLERIVANPDCPMWQISPIGEAEEGRLLVEWNNTAAALRSECCVHDLFEEQVRLTPDAPALMCEERALTYIELDRRADCLAAILKARGSGPDQVVGVFVERSVEMVVALLGTLKAGGAYLPLDPNYPTDRLRYMLSDAAPKVVVTEERLRSLLPPVRAAVVVLDSDLTDVAEPNLDDPAEPDLRPLAQNLVYLIYTSGSTGRPKGTGMAHRSMVNLIEWHRRTFAQSQGERVLQFAALSFDVAFQEIFSTLCTGGTLVLVNEQLRRDTRALLEFLIAHHIERLFVPPLMLQALAECYKTSGIGAPRGLQHVITAGEQLRISPEVVHLLRHLPDCRLHNHYGPTETHVVTASTLPENPEAWSVFPSIGQPIANAALYVLDEQRLLVPIGVKGELFIGGVGLARGYINRPELTAERFVADPFSADNGARLYKTGDLARWRADGTLEYLGRNDDQVKLRGYRIELGEIEAQLLRHAQVREAAAIVREDASGERRLVVYATQRGQTTLTQQELRSHLKAVLPDHMLPSAFVTVDRMPLTPNGKLDRHALPAPEARGGSGRRYEPPEGETEEILARIWQELLQVERVGREENFFDLGGHSLLVLRVLFRVNEFFATALRVTDIYKHPTIRELAALLGGANAEDYLIDLEREASLSDDLIPAPSPRSGGRGAILLTGSTGFVGRFLLRQLLQDTEAIIYCLVRASSQREASSRLRQMLEKWNLWDCGRESRIVAITGDLRLPRLGIDGITYEIMSEAIDAIYHCATSMNHLETYTMAKPVNVGSVKEVLKLATYRHQKVVNYISTLGVFSPATTNKIRFVDEASSISHEKHWHSRGYVASKCVGEKILMNSRERGIPCNIFRIGLVWGDTQQGRYDELQRGYRIIKSCLLSGLGIENYHYEMAPTPVDYVTTAIVSLATQHPDGGGLFHISSGAQMEAGFFERCNEVVGTSLELVPLYAWICRMKRLHEMGQSMPVVPLVDFAFSMSEEAFHERQRRILESSVRYKCSRTVQQLEAVGIVAPELDDALLSLCIHSMLSRDPELRALREESGDLLDAQSPEAELGERLNGVGS